MMSKICNVFLFIGCVPISGAGEYNGWFCPCHGSKFDLAGRVFKGSPAPINLVVPPYQYLTDTTVLIGDDTKAEA